MSREVRQLILADGLIVALGLAVWLMMGCSHSIGPCRPYQGSGLAPYADLEKLSTSTSEGNLTLVARVPLHNPTAAPVRARVTCRFWLGDLEIASKSAAAKVCAGSSRAVSLSAFVPLDSESQAGISCATSWR